MASPNSGSDLKALVLQATDIVELIGQTVALKRRGKDFLGLCPFHQDKNPSFYVIPSKQIYHCFACKASGNAIDFVMNRDRVEFKDALRILAEKAGIEFNLGRGDKARAGERQQLLDAHSAACGFFENLFHNTPAGAPAREYLAKRGFTIEILKQFRVGMAIESWDALLKSPQMRKFPPPLLSLGGLVKPRQSGDGFYDTFRNRVMFPIFEAAESRIIAFGGRKMPGSEDPAKYLNSPETPLFAKSQSVFGLNFGRQKMIDTGTAIIVEGYTDVIMAHQFGVSNVVSPMGTAMTEQHLNLIRRFANKIVLLFDPDEAGDLAVDRSVELFLGNDIEIAIASMPPGEDPDEFLLKNGAQAFENVINTARDVLSYKWSQLVRQFNASAGDLTAQKKAVEAYLELLASARGAGPVDPMRWGQALARVSRLTEMPIDDLHRRFNKKKSGPGNLARQAVPVVAAETPATPPPAETTDILRAREMAERQILGILLKEPHRWHQVQSVVHAEEFAGPLRRKLAEIYWNHQVDEGEPVFADFIGLLEEPGLKELAFELLELAENDLSDVEQTLRGALEYFEEERRRAHEQKQLADLRRISSESAGQDAVTEQFAKFLQNNQAADPRRLGPVVRVKQSGS